MPLTNRVSSRVRLLLKSRPKCGALVRYGDRIAEVLGEAPGERVMIRSLHADGIERRSAVKWKNLKLLDDQLFWCEPAGIKPSSLPPPATRAGGHRVQRPTGSPRP
jgi:hypothetical protein